MKAHLAVVPKRKNKVWIRLDHNRIVNITRNVTVVLFLHLISVIKHESLTDFLSSVEHNTRKSLK